MLSDERDLPTHSGATGGISIVARVFARDHFVDVADDRADRGEERDEDDSEEDDGEEGDSEARFPHSRFWTDSGRATS